MYGTYTYSLEPSKIRFPNSRMPIQVLFIRFVWGVVVSLLRICVSGICDTIVLLSNKTWFWAILTHICPACCGERATFLCHTWMSMQPAFKIWVVFINGTFLAVEYI
jgi:hypothetical protein